MTSPDDGRDSTSPTHYQATLCAHEVLAYSPTLQVFGAHWHATPNTLAQAYMYRFAFDAYAAFLR